MSNLAIWPFLPASRHTPSVVMAHPPLQLLRWGWSWSQSIDQPQDLLEQFLRYRDLGHLEDEQTGIHIHSIKSDTVILEGTKLRAVLGKRPELPSLFV
jgi:hypothetical protein